MTKHLITKSEYIAALEMSSKNKDKDADKRLKVITLRYEGMTLQEIADKLDYSQKSVVNRLIVRFKDKGLERYVNPNYGNNHRLLSLEKETEIMKGFIEKATIGELVTVKQIKAAFDEEVGRDTGHSYIYYVLKRHKWRKVMPRPQHPNKATEEEIEASKKLMML